MQSTVTSTKQQEGIIELGKRVTEFLGKHSPIEAEAAIDVARALIRAEAARKKLVRINARDNSL